MTASISSRLRRTWSGDSIASPTASRKEPDPTRPRKHKSNTARTSSRNRQAEQPTASTQGQSSHTSSRQSYFYASQASSSRHPITAASSSSTLNRDAWDDSSVASPYPNSAAMSFDDEHKDTSLSESEDHLAFSLSPTTTDEAGGNGRYDWDRSAGADFDDSQPLGAITRSGVGRWLSARTGGSDRNSGQLELSGSDNGHDSKSNSSQAPGQLASKRSSFNFSFAANPAARFREVMRSRTLAKASSGPGSSSDNVSLVNTVAEHKNLADDAGAERQQSALGLDTHCHVLDRSSPSTANPSHDTKTDGRAADPVNTTLKAEVAPQKRYSSDYAAGSRNGVTESPPLPLPSSHGGNESYAQQHNSRGTRIASRDRSRLRQPSKSIAKLESGLILGAACWACAELHRWREGSAPTMSISGSASIAPLQSEGILSAPLSGQVLGELSDENGSVISLPDGRLRFLTEFGWITVASAAYLVSRPKKTEKSYVWTTDDRGYRDCKDDGVLYALLFGPLLATTTLLESLRAVPLNLTPVGAPLPPPWSLDTVSILKHTRSLSSSPGISALSTSRASLLTMQSLTSTALLAHLLATRLLRSPASAKDSNWKKLRSFLGFSLLLACLLEAVREGANLARIPFWTSLARWELFTAVFIYQVTLYTISRLARKCFTLGELAIVSTLGVTLSVESINITLAKLRPLTTPFVKTFRTPTPLLVFQLALVVGTFAIGFLFSPLLYLSRNLAQKPVHRLRWPAKRDLHRRLLAGFFYFFTAAFIIGVLGMWVRWLLGGKDPWFWVAAFMLKGPRPWARPILVVYWICLVGLSVAGWQSIVTSARHARLRSSFLTNQAQKREALAMSMDGNGPVAAKGAFSSSTLAASLQSLVFQQQSRSVRSASPSQSQASSAQNGGSSSMQNAAAALSVASKGGDAGSVALKRASHLSLNARRKFFHALAVLMFCPAIAFDPTFASLAFSLAFSVFIFAEYVRYFALYPFGASLHVFLSEFLDAKDSGPVILSHFYLLTGCGGPLWLEGRSMIVAQTGVLVLGVGDALASVIGRRYGRHKWAGSNKTIEGSVAFWVTIMASAWMLRLLGWTEMFSLPRYGVVVLLLALLEGASHQNDNLVLPVFGLITATLMGV